MMFDEDSSVNFVRRERRIITITLEPPPSPTGRLKIANDPRPVFETGEEIRGQLLVEIKGGKPVEQIRLSLMCLQQIRWLMQAKRKSIINTMFDSGYAHRTSRDNRIFFERKKVFDILLQDFDTKLTDGKYEFPFCFVLPRQNLPSSLNSFYSLIKYTLEAFSVDVDKRESRGEKEIIVLSSADERFDQTISRTMEKSLPLGNGQVGITVWLERKGFVPGEVLPINITINNDSNELVQPRVSVYQTQICTNDHLKQQLETELNKEPIIGQVVEANTYDDHQVVKFPLSENLVLSLATSFILIKYHVYVTLDIPHAFDVHLKVPFVVINRKALHQNSQRLARQKSSKSQKSN